jgi:hypothetical protein
MPAPGRDRSGRSEAVTRARVAIRNLAVLGAAVMAGPFSPAAPTAVTLAHEADGKPARIHAGACDDYRGVVYILTGVGAEVTPDGTPVPQPERVGPADAIPVSRSETTIPVALTDLTAVETAVVVYASDAEMDRPDACGNVGGPLTSQMPGMVMPGDELAVWLAGRDGTGVAGVALLEAAGRETVVRIYLGEGLGGQPQPDDDHYAAATPAA